jgi:hypothetical protein
MSAVEYVGSAPMAAVAHAPAWRRELHAARELAVTEAWRLLRHPAVIFALLYTVGVGAIESSWSVRDAYSLVTGLYGFFMGPFTFVAAHLVASRDRRNDVDTVTDTLPVSPRARTAGLLGAVALGPVVVTALLTVATRYLVELRGVSFVVTPSMWEMATCPLMVLGGGWLGIMVARWVPWTPAATLVLVALVAFHVWISSRERLALLGAYVDWPVWGSDGKNWAGRLPGSEQWHLGYLLCLCGMAACGALVATRGRRLPWLLLGATLTAGAVVAGMVQLP